jgi:hypothetical protein
MREVKEVEMMVGREEIGQETGLGSNFLPSE